MFWQMKEPKPEMKISDRVVPGVANVFTGGETTYGEMFQMATDMANKDWRTPSEKGLALSILAIIEDFNKVLDA